MKKDLIKSVRARQTIDCNCRPMVEVDVVTESGYLGRGSAPTGKSVGEWEAFVLRDNNPDEYQGLSVRKAVANVNDIIGPKLIGMDVTDQKAIDQLMIDLDGTANKSNLGSNAIYSTSIATFRAAAAIQHIPLYEYITQGPIKTVPVPSFNMINGGLNDGIKQSINEFIIMPWKAESIEKAVEIAVLVFEKVGEVIEKRTGKPAQVGRSMGWIAPSENPYDIFDILQEAIDQTGFTEECSFALDAAASEMYDDATKTYYMDGKQLTSDEIIEFYKDLSQKYTFVFMEDILDENDWEGYQKAHRVLKDTLIIADDLTVTNPEKLRQAKELNAIDGFVLKPNQIGTITEALDAYNFAKEQNWVAIPSGRSGGVIDDVVMDFSVGLGVPFQKNGCPRSGERIEKLNFLMRAADLHPGCTMTDITPWIKK